VHQAIARCYLEEVQENICHLVSSCQCLHQEMWSMTANPHGIIHPLRTSSAVLLDLFDPLHPFKKQFSAIHPHHDKSSYFRKLKLGGNDIGCIL